MSQYSIIASNGVKFQSNSALSNRRKNRFLIFCKYFVFSFRVKKKKKKPFGRLFLHLCPCALNFNASDNYFFSLAGDNGPSIYCFPILLSQRRLCRTCQRFTPDSRATATCILHVRNERSFFFFILESQISHVTEAVFRLFYTNSK